METSEENATNNGVYRTSTESLLKHHIPSSKKLKGLVKRGGIFHIQGIYVKQLQSQKLQISNKTAKFY